MLHRAWLRRIVVSSLTSWLLVAAAGRIAGQNLLHDGDFDNVSPFHDGDAGLWWTVYGSGHVQVVNDEGSTSGTQAAAFNVANNSSGNLLGQNFPTSGGQTYALDFDAAVFGVPCFPLPQLGLQVRSDQNTLLDGLVTPPYADPSGVAFRHYHYTFVAASTFTTLEFRDAVSSSNSDIVLDSVSVTAISPTPSPTPGPSPNLGPNIVVNGDFETGPVDTNGSVTGWTVVGGKVAVEPEGSTSGNYSAAFDVGGAWPSNSLSQTVRTSPGHLYVLNFDTGIFGGNQSCTTQLRVEALGASLLLDESATPAYAGVFDPSAVLFQHYQYYFVANSPSTTLRFVNMGNSGTSDTVLDTVSLAAQQGMQLSFGQWKSAHFTSAQLNDNNISGWSADPDKDGIPNGMEYYSDTDPMGGIRPWESAALPHAGFQNDGVLRYLTFSYRRLIGWTGNPPIVAVADNFSSWDSTGTQVEAVGNPVPTGDGITETVTVRIKTSLNQGLQRKFLRLQLSQ